MNEDYAEKPYTGQKKRSYKKPVILGLMALGLVGIAFGLLNYYGVITGTATVTQAIQITQPSPPTYTITGVGGETFDNLLQIKNNNPTQIIPVNFNAVEVSSPSGAVFGVDINVSFYDAWSGSACTGVLIVNPKNIPANNTVNYCARTALNVAAVPGIYVYNATVTP